MASKPRRGRSAALAAQLHALSDGLEALDPGAARSRLLAALASEHAALVKRAAELVQANAFADLARDLESAFERLLVDGEKRDPGCHAKLALLEALDYLETSREEPFVRGARHVQLEPAYGAPHDAACGVRARSIAALARIGYDDFLLLAAELLHDRETSVRQATADALAHHGVRAGAALLLFKLRIGDEDPMVTLAALSALLSLAPDWALPKLRLDLGARDEETRELAALALGQSKHPEALSLLVAALRAGVQPSERASLLRAISLQRSERALEVLLDVVASGRAADARAALRALAVRRFEPGVSDRARAAAARNRHVDLRAELDAEFSD